MPRHPASPKDPLQIVWFKRDLRVHDHAPLAEAAAAGPVLPLYVAEPELWAQPEMAGRHWAFITDCLEELRRALAALGQPLVIRTGTVIDALEDARRLGAVALWSHEETGQAWTYDRDKAVARWARSHGLPWRQLRQTGVIRGLKSRDGWAQTWNRLMARPPAKPPALKPLSGLDPGPIPSAADLGLGHDPCPGRQRGGRDAGTDILYTFLHERGRDYRRAMSSPNTAYEQCSRISPHLAWGSLSMRECYQAALRRQDDLAALGGPETTPWKQSVQSFIARLHWHCHFMQKLEDQTDIEHRNLHRGYDGMREGAFDRARFEAWAEGQTGLPFCDACMRALRHSGYINFRMRAMLAAVSAYHLWLHWREPALHLARQFTDFEPGIHFPQMQMQSGTTGINTIRIYNPVKQGKDHDSDGAFIRRWVPELAAVPTRFIHEPWKMTKAARADSGVVLGRHYPDPIVDPVAAAREAKERVYAMRRGEGFRGEADAIQTRHGSRKSGLNQTGQRPRRTRRHARASAQLTMDLGGE